MSKTMIADEMPFLHDPLQLGFVSGNVFADTKKSGLNPVFLEQIQNTVGFITRRAVIKTQSDAFFLCLAGTDGSQKKSPLDEISSTKQHTQINQQKPAIA